MQNNIPNLIPRSERTPPCGNGYKPFCSGAYFMHYLNFSLQDIEGEIWKPIEEFEGIYEISNFGRLKTLSRVDCRGQRRKMFIRRQSNDDDGYLINALSKDRVNTMFKMHRLVAIAFIPNPENLPQVNHKDGNKKNNCVDNLEWCTNYENLIHATNTGLRNFSGAGNPSATLTAQQALEIYQSKEKHRVLQSLYGISKSAIGHIKIGYTWSDVTGHKNCRKK